MTTELKFFAASQNCVEQFRLVRAGDEPDRRVCLLHFLEILGDEQGLAALGLGVEHGDADDLRRERPQAHEPGDFLALGVLGDGVVNLLRLAEQVFLLRLVEQFERQRGGFDVENECGHAEILTANLR